MTTDDERDTWTEDELPICAQCGERVLPMGDNAEPPAICAECWLLAQWAMLPPLTERERDEMETAAERRSEYR